MAGALFAYQRLSEGTLTGGSWESTLPVTNAIVARLSAKAQSTDDANASTLINRDYGAAVSLQLFAVVRSNLQKDARWRIRGSASSDMSSPVYDSDWMDCWPEMWADGVLQPSHPNYSDQLFTNADIAEYQFDVLHIAPAAASARYWRIEFDDTTNTDGFVSVGFLVMAPVYQPGLTDNVAGGAELGLASTSTTGLALSGFRTAQRRRSWRTYTLAFPELALDEAVSVFHAMQRYLGLDRWVYVVLDPADTNLLQWRSFLAVQEELSPVQLIQWGEQHAAIKLSEVR